LRVEFSEEARAQVREIDAWWRSNLPRAPDLFERELGHAIAVLEQTPTLGTRYEGASKSVRRLLLRHSHYHLYFEEQVGQLFVLAVWSAHRGRGPKLSTRFGNFASTT
jgi:plasmid stabilization system protein ParE